MTLDEVVPRPHFRECHERRIAAPPESVRTALHELRLSDLAPPARSWGGRTPPARLAGRPPPRMVSGRLLEEGPLPVLAADPGTQSSPEA